MSEVKVTFRGWPGHFICAHDCYFRLNTLLEYGDKKVVISTVGLLADPKKDKFMEIGLNRHFETMAFWAKFDGEFWDADVSKEIGFESPWRYDKVDMELKANEGHYKVIEELSTKLQDGSLKAPLVPFPEPLSEEEYNENIDPIEEM